jgi:hypothetical protein
MSGWSGHRVRCPECGHLATPRRYTNGDRAYMHDAKTGPFSFIEVTDFCYVSATGDRATGMDTP